MIWPTLFPWNRRALALLWYCNMIQLGRNVTAFDLSTLSGEARPTEFAIKHLAHVTSWSRS